MPSARLASLRAKLADRQARRSSQSPSPLPEIIPTTGLGVTVDNPQDDTSTQAGTVRPQRVRRSTSRGQAWAEERSRSRTRSERNLRTRSRNARESADGTRGRSSDTRQLAHSTSSGLAGNENVNALEGESQAPAHNQAETHTEVQSPDQVAAALEFRQRFVQDASRILGEDASKYSTQDLQSMLNFVRSRETPAMDATSGETSAVLLSAAPLGVGGGWHRNHIDPKADGPAAAASGSSLNLKRGSSGSESDVVKRQRLTQATDDTATQSETEPSERWQPTQATNDTATQPETDDEQMRPTLLSPAPPPPSPPTLSVAGTVVPDSQGDPQSLHGSPNLGNSPFGSPSRTVTRACLHAKLKAFELQRAPGLSRATRNELGQLARSPFDPRALSPDPCPDIELRPNNGGQLDMEIDANMPAPTTPAFGQESATFPESSDNLQTHHVLPGPNAGPNASPATLARLQAELRQFQRERAAEIAALGQSQSDGNIRLGVGSRSTHTRTYEGTRSHAYTTTSSQRVSNTQGEPRDPTCRSPESRPSLCTNVIPQSSTHSNRCSNTHSNIQSGTRSNGRTSSYANIRARINDLSRDVEVSRATSPSPAGRAGTRRSHPSTSSARRSTGPHRPDPIAQGRADSVAFNQQFPCRRKARTQVSTRATGRQHEVGTMRASHELLPDNEADRSHAEARALGIQPARGRKRKPLARDTTGVARQILTLARLHSYAASLVEGTYMTRGAAMLLVSAVHEETWAAELPDLPYERATHEQCEVMVNGFATNRGKSKDHTRPAIQFGYGFRKPALTQDDVEFNLELYNLLRDDGFICLDVESREGHYENPEINHCIAAALFHGPNSVGVLYQDYFSDMPLTVVAFVVALMEFCIEEWSNGWFESKDLSAANMLEKYEYHLDELTELQKIAPARVEELQREWFQYAMKYSGASSSRPPKARKSARSHFRPDTPPTASPPPEPEVEHYPDGRISARSKGKGRATD